jgi:hypothetical protein
MRVDRESGFSTPTSPVGPALLDRQTAALVTSAAVADESIDQPTTRRLNTSSTTAQ